MSEYTELVTLAGKIAESEGFDGNDAADLANELVSCVEDFIAEKRPERRTGVERRVDVDKANSLSAPVRRRGDRRKS